MKILLTVLAFLSVFSNIYSQTEYKQTNVSKEKKIVEIIFNQLKSKHLITKKIDDDFSKKFFKEYLNKLDFYKIFFLQSDIEEFKAFETKLDDQLKANDLSFFYLTYDRIKLRMTEGKELYTNVCKNKVDLNETEKDFDPYNLAFDNTKADQSKKWKSIIKLDAYTKTSQYCLKINKNQKLTKKKYDSIFENSSKEYVESFVNRMESTRVNIDNFSKEEFLNLYINSFILLFDNYSQYFIPSQRDEYYINQTGKIIGVGIKFNLNNNFAEIVALTPGAPAAKTKKIDVGDIVLKVAQENEAPVNVVGYSLYEVGKLTRGKSGTNVKLTIKKKKGNIEEVSIKRGVVSSNDSYVKSSLVEKNNVKYAIISFPRFYNELDDDLIRNAADDFEDVIKSLKSSDIEGIIIDIRNNKGGSLEAANEILSNFIDKNITFQSKDREQKVVKFESEKDKKNWDKGMVLLVNSETSSTAEMFASAFQDNNLGVVMGYKTFGKNTTEEFIDLNTLNSNKLENEDLGMLKLTTQKFYRLNGKSVQKIGVIPNIVFPLEFEEYVNKPYSIPLENDFVNPCKKISKNTTKYDKICESSRKRILKNDYFASLNLLKPTDLSLKNVSLNYKIVKNKLNAFIEKQNKIAEPKIANILEFKSTPTDVKFFKQNEYLILKRKSWYNELKTDLIIDEGLNVLEAIYLNSVK